MEEWKAFGCSWHALRKAGYHKSDLNEYFDSRSPAAGRVDFTRYILTMEEDEESSTYEVIESSQTGIYKVIASVMKSVSAPLPEINSNAISEKITHTLRDIVTTNC